MKVKLEFNVNPYTVAFLVVLMLIGVATYMNPQQPPVQPVQAAQVHQVIHIMDTTTTTTTGATFTTTIGTSTSTVIVGSTTTVTGTATATNTTTVTIASGTFTSTQSTVTESYTNTILRQPQPSNTILLLGLFFVIMVTFILLLFDRSVLAMLIGIIVGLIIDVAAGLLPIWTLLMTVGLLVLAVFYRMRSQGGEAE